MLARPRAARSRSLVLVSAALFVLWMALLGADRLDLLGGAAPFVVTPFLALSPVLVLTQWAHRRRSGSALLLPRTALWYAALLAAFFTIGAASVLWSLDPAVSLNRVLLVAVQAACTLLIALHVAALPDARALAARGAELGVLCIALMDGVAVLSFLGLLPRELVLGPATLALEPAVYAGFVPRLAGTAVDANLTGFLLVIYALLAPRVRGVAVVLLLLTISRSALLALAAAVLGAVWEQGLRTRVVPLRTVLFGTLAGAAALLWVGRTPAALEAAAGLAAPFAERFDVSGGSASEHRLLIARGVSEATEFFARAALGMGWGSSHLVLQDIFPGHRYGNFHSLYVTVFAEAGALALVVMLALVLVPLLRAAPWRPAVAALAAFSVFYQATTQPVFWLVLAMAWISAASAWPRSSPWTAPR